LVARAGPSGQAISVASCGEKLESDHAQAVRSGHATRLAIPGRYFVACVPYPCFNNRGTRYVTSTMANVAKERPPCGALAASHDGRLRKAEFQRPVSPFTWELRYFA
jgi:hypothetical protein